jgi:hypothetical protein
VPTLDHADAPLAPGPPFLAVAEPALLLLAPARSALGGAIGNADPLDTFGLGSGFVVGGVEGRIGCNQTRVLTRVLSGKTAADLSVAADSILFLLGCFWEIVFV